MGVINLTRNIDSDYCDRILKSGNIELIQFREPLQDKVNLQTLKLVNDKLLSANPGCRICFNFGDPNDWRVDFKTLDVLQYLPNLKSLQVSVLKGDIDLSPINKYLELTDLGLYSKSRQLDMSFVKDQFSLKKLHLADKIKNLGTLNQLSGLKKLMLCQKLENLDDLRQLHSLHELHFWGGHVADLSGIENIGKIERLTLQDMRKMTQNELLPINKMTHLKYLQLWNLNQLTDISWLTIPIRERYIRCKNV
jgi:hypothetical protein